MPQIRINSRFGFVNCYLVQKVDGFTLVDTEMLGSSADLILNAASQFNMKVRRILLTHAHTDHVGSVDALLAELGAQDTELISNARSLPLLRKPPDLSLLPGEPAGKIKGGLPRYRCQANPAAK